MLEKENQEFQRSQDERMLVAKLRDGNNAAYEELIRAYGPRLLILAQNMLNDQDSAKDCLQEAYIQAFKNIDKFEERSTLSTWLYRITVNCALMHLRSQKQKNETSFDALMPKFDGDGCRIEPLWAEFQSVETMMESAETKKVVYKAIQQLPEDYRIVLILRDIEELSTNDAAEILEVSKAVVKTRLHRARSALKKLLEPLLKEGQSC